MDAKWRRIYEEFTSLIPRWLHLKYSQFGAFCASWRFPRRSPDTLLAIIFVVFFVVFFFTFFDSEIKCVFYPPGFIKAWLAYRVTGASSFDHIAVFYPSVMFLFFSPHGRQQHRKQESTGRRMHLTKLCSSSSVCPCVILCAFCQYLGRTASDMMNRMQFVWLHLFTWACSETSWIHRFHKVVHKHVLLFVCSLAIIFSSASCLTYNRRFVLYD